MGTALDTRLLRRDRTEVAVRIQLSPTRIGGERGVLALVRDPLQWTQADQLVRQHEDLLMLLVDREAVAMEANAGVIHTLFGIGLHLQGAMANTIEPGAKVAMQQAVTDIDEAITEMREHLFRHIDIPI